MEPLASAGAVPDGVERVLYVLEGEATLALPDVPERVLCPAASPTGHPARPAHSAR